MDEAFIFVQAVSQYFEVIIGSVYLSPLSDFAHFKDKFEKSIYDITLKYPQSAIILGGDLNCKIGNLNQLDEDVFAGINNIISIRTTLDERVDKRGRDTVELFERNGYYVLNGRTKGDEPAQFTYSEKGNASIIDMAWVNSTATTLIRDFKVLQIPTRSDHFPVSVELYSNNFTNYNINKEPYFKWNEEKIESYKDLIKYPPNMQNFKSIDDIFNDLMLAIKEAASEADMKIIPSNVSKIVKVKRWFDFECVEKKEP